ncbi:SGNH/GDSL hydrolase family protein [Rhodococcus globerulus]|uniref:SGNH/GDSL hydrolase family protein n=1 Tax=Rhodococcus globerulus TaxID=33008 RepID=UPI001C599727|nr:SGNH/GDSL hydrolase family protein [Rhodococcus globerulus]QXW04677.1 SGNH/GDSL hydrolase family protein [Rhodococcus globerulus]
MGHYADVGAGPDVVAKIKKYNAAIKAALGWRYVDLHSVFSPNGSLLPEYVASDGLHLNTAGNNLLDTIIKAAIASMNWFPGRPNLAASLVASFRGDDIAGTEGAAVNT